MDVTCFQIWQALHWTWKATSKCPFVLTVGTRPQFLSKVTILCMVFFNLCFIFPLDCENALKLRSAFVLCTVYFCSSINFAACVFIAEITHLFHINSYLGAALQNHWCRFFFPPAWQPRPNCWFHCMMHIFSVCWDQCKSGPHSAWCMLMCLFW